MKTALSVALLISVAMALLTCGGAEDLLQQNPTGNLPLPGDPLTDEQRMAVLEDCRTFVNALGDITSDKAQQAIVEWLQSRPEFEDAGMESGNVWAYFYDGRVVTILPAWLSKEEPGGRVANTNDASGKYADGKCDSKKSSAGESAVAGSDVGRITGETSAGGNSELGAGNGGGAGNRTTGIPLVKTGILFNGMGTAFEDGRQHLYDMFTVSLADYKLMLQPASIDNLKAVKDQAIVYVLTHGGIGFKKIRILGDRVYALWTSDLVTTLSDEKNKEDLDNGVLAYSLGLQNKNESLEWHYSITEEFVKKYMTFAENAIIYVDACNSMNDESKSFGEALLDKCANKKGTFVGWTKPTSSVAYIPTQRYIFDRMIASNDVSGTEQKPDQRPFDFVSVYNDMFTYPEVFHLGVSKHGGRLAYNSRSTTEVLLTPSISYITMYDWESIMVLHGLFSDGPVQNGHVWINGKEASVIQWSKNFIICKIDDEGGDSFGNVMVTYNDQRSNTVPLSAWTIPLTVTRDEAGIKTEATLKLRLRGDVHRFRAEPNATPIVERFDSLGLEVVNGESGWQFSKESNGHYRVGGSRQAECTKDDCQYKDTHSWKEDEGDLPYDFSQNSFRFGALYLWSPDLKKLTVRLSFLIPKINSNEEFVVRCPKSESKHTDTDPKSLTVSVPSDDFDVVELKFDENFNIVGDDKKKSRGYQWSHCDDTDSLVTHVKWPTVHPENPPTDETPARVGL
ncbi:hypothetical protein WBG78_14355 [Chryseolinea sp. T2]|uniref:hypothetical protein n=1 Tax=Chryseolinea sp. T2 TaxID=3129255 RepID=UPI0030786D09